MKLYGNDVVESEDSLKGAIDRREFMIYSSCFMGGILLPSRSHAFILPFLAILIRPFISFAVRRTVVGIGVGLSVDSVSTGYKITSKLLGKKNKNRKSKIETEVVLDKPLMLSYNKKEIQEKSREIQSDLSTKTELSINPEGVEDVLNHYSREIKKSDPELPVVWDQKGYARTSKTLYMNSFFIRIENKTSHYVERKIQLILLNESRQKEHMKQYTIKAEADDYGVFNLSHLFHNLPSTGIKEITYKIIGNYKDIEVSSPNKTILVARLLDI
jgi:hypothetical protein